MQCGFSTTTEDHQLCQQTCLRVVGWGYQHATLTPSTRIRSLYDTARYRQYRHPPPTQTPASTRSAFPLSFFLAPTQSCHNHTCQHPGETRTIKQKSSRVGPQQAPHYKQDHRSDGSFPSITIVAGAATDKPPLSLSSLSFIFSPSLPLSSLRRPQGKYKDQQEPPGKESQFHSAQSTQLQPCRFSPFPTAQLVSLLPQNKIHWWIGSFSIFSDATSPGCRTTAGAAPKPLPSSPPAKAGTISVSSPLSA